ncbi:MAG: formate dehydrogenase accessory sulfurtransferase FdhD [Candidatus Thorarchaeota archaeon]
MDRIRKASVTELHREELVSSEEKVAIEQRTRIRWSDGSAILETTASPGQERELAIGLLTTMGIAVPYDAVKVKEAESTTTIIVDPTEVHNIENPKIADTKISSQDIVRGVSRLRNLQILLKETGCAHGGLVVELHGQKYAFAEDIRRQNALNKTIGSAVIQGIGLHACALFFTGRLTSEVVGMAKHAGIPMVVSLGVTTDEGIRIAQEANMTLVGSEGRWIYHIGSVRVIP